MEPVVHRPGPFPFEGGPNAHPNFIGPGHGKLDRHPLHLRGRAAARHLDGLLDKMPQPRQQQSVVGKHLSQFFHVGSHPQANRHVAPRRFLLQNRTFAFQQGRHVHVIHGPVRPIDRFPDPGEGFVDGPGDERRLRRDRQPRPGQKGPGQSKAQVLPMQHVQAFGQGPARVGPGAQLMGGLPKHEQRFQRVDEHVVVRKAQFAPHPVVRKIHRRIPPHPTARAGKQIRKIVGTGVVRAVPGQVIQHEGLHGRAGFRRERGGSKKVQNGRLGVPGPANAFPGEGLDGFGGRPVHGHVAVEPIQNRRGSALLRQQIDFRRGFADGHSKTVGIVPGIGVVQQVQGAGRPKLAFGHPGGPRLFLRNRHLQQGKRENDFPVDGLAAPPIAGVGIDREPAAGRHSSVHYRDQPGIRLDQQRDQFARPLVDDVQGGEGLKGPLQIHGRSGGAVDKNNRPLPGLFARMAPMEAEAQIPFGRFKGRGRAGIDAQRFELQDQRGQKPSGGGNVGTEGVPPNPLEIRIVFFEPDAGPQARELQNEARGIFEDLTEGLEGQPRAPPRAPIVLGEEERPLNVGGKEKIAQVRPGPQIQPHRSPPLRIQGPSNRLVVGHVGGVQQAGANGPVVLGGRSRGSFLPGSAVPHHAETEHGAHSHRPQGRFGRTPEGRQGVRNPPGQGGVLRRKPRREQRPGGGHHRQDPQKVSRRRPPPDPPRHRGQRLRKFFVDPQGPAQGQVQMQADEHLQGAGLLQDGVGPAEDGPFRWKKSILHRKAEPVPGENPMGALHPGRCSETAFDQHHRNSGGNLSDEILEPGLQAAPLPAVPFQKEIERKTEKDHVARAHERDPIIENRRAQHVGPGVFDGFPRQHRGPQGRSGFLRVTPGGGPGPLVVVQHQGKFKTEIRRPQLPHVGPGQEVRSGQGVEQPGVPVQHAGGHQQLNLPVIEGKPIRRFERRNEPVQNTRHRFAPHVRARAAPNVDGARHPDLPGPVPVRETHEILVGLPVGGGEGPGPGIESPGGVGHVSIAGDDLQGPQPFLERDPHAAVGDVGHFDPAVPPVGPGPLQGGLQQRLFVGTMGQMAVDVVVEQAGPAAFGVQVNIADGLAIP